MTLKKILTTLVLSAVMLTANISALPAYAADMSYPYYDKATKVTGSAYLSCVYYYKLSIKDNKLIATGQYNRRSKYYDLKLLKFQMQLTKPVTYPNWYIGTDGIARVDGFEEHLKIGLWWELKTVIPVVRSSPITSGSDDEKILFSIDLAGLADGIYNLQEVTSYTTGGITKREGHYGDSTLIVVYKGVPSIQTTWIYPDLTEWWHDKDFYIM